MEVTLQSIAYEDKQILSQLIQLYRYDSSEFDAHTLNKHGLYSYKYLDHQWTENYRRPILIKVNGEIAGFALLILDVPKSYVKLSSEEKTNVISDFFIMRKYRRKGVGKKATFSLFKQFKGVWEVKQTHSNKNAYEFWKKVITAYTGNNILKEKILHNEVWQGPILVFKS